MLRTPRPRAALALLLVLLTALSILAPTRGRAQVGGSGRPQVSVLASGLTVATREQPDAELLALAVAVRAGGRYEPASLRGGSHLLEHMHFLGSQRYPTPASTFNPIAATGGDMNARTSSEATTYYATVPAGYFQTALDVLADMLQRPLFPSEPVERERGVVQEELRGQPTGSVGAAGTRLSDQLLGQAGQDPGGTIATVGAIDIAELLRYRTERYTGRNMVLAVVGPVRHVEVVAAVEAAFRELPAGEERRQPALPPPPGGMRLDGTSPSIPIIAAGQRIPGLDSPDYAVIRLIDGILDVPGTRMADAFEEELDATGGTRISQNGDSGLWFAFAGEAPSAADDVLAIAQTQIRLLQDELVGDDELQATKRYVAGQARLAGDSVETRALRLAELTLLGVYQTEEDYTTAILAITAADVQRVARTYFDPDTFTVVVLARRTGGSN
jgi:predicted Zn-dependent peptidase